MQVRNQQKNGDSTQCENIKEVAEMLRAVGQRTYN